MRRRVARVLAGVGVVSFVLDVVIAVVFASGTGTVTAGVAGAEAEVDGGGRYLLAGVVFLAGALIGGFFLVRGLHGLRGEGPWIAGTRHGLLVATPRGHDVHPWSGFTGGRVEGGDVVLTRPAREGRASADQDIVGVPDPQRVLDACLARIHEKA